MKFQVTKQGSTILGKEACVKLGLITRVDKINTDIQAQLLQEKELSRMINLGVIIKQEEPTPRVNSIAIVR